MVVSYGFLKSLCVLKHTLSLQRIGIAKNCMMLLEKHVWKSYILVDTKVRLYQAYVLPGLMYGSET